MRVSSPQLVAVCGLPGAGKSTVSSHVVELVEGTRLRTDVVRKELFEEPTYTDDERDRVYDELFARAEHRLASGETVVLDATFAERERRHAARDVADTCGVAFRLIHVVCDPAVTEHRIATRDDVSDADVDVYRQFRREFDSLTLEHHLVDNSGSLAETRSRVAALFEQVTVE